MPLSSLTSSDCFCRHDFTGPSGSLLTHFPRKLLDSRPRTHSGLRHRLQEQSVRGDNWPAAPGRPGQQHRLVLKMMPKSLGKNEYCTPKVPKLVSNSTEQSNSLVSSSSQIENPSCLMASLGQAIKGTERGRKKGKGQKTAHVFCQD